MAKKTDYYLDEKGGLWKKENDKEYFFSRKKLEWVECQIAYIWPAWEYQYKIDEGEAQMVHDDYVKDGIWDAEETPFRYYANDNDLVFAEDILGNEFIVLDDMSLKAAPKGTVDLYWGGVTELEAKALTVGTLFELKRGYTLMDEDYSYELIVYKDGSIYIRQMESYCYEKETTVVEKEKTEIIKTKVLELYKNYKKDIDNFITMNCDRRTYVGSINEKHFYLNSFEDHNFIKEIAISIKKIIEECYPGEVNWNISISTNGYEIY